MHFDVIVVGGGMVGLSCVLALAQQGFKVALVETQPNPPKPLPTNNAPFDNRVVAISRASEQWFERLGVFSGIQKARSCAYQHMKVWDATMDGNIHFNAMDYFEPDLGRIVEQQVILGALWLKLSEYKEVTYFWGTSTVAQESSAEYVELTLSSTVKIQASLVIAADGANSALRTLCQIPSRGWDYDQLALVATVKGTLTHHNTAFQRFAQDGSLALLPLSEPFHSSIVWATSHANAAKLQQLDEHTFNQTLSREIEGVMGDLCLVGQRFTFELRTHHARRYATARCVLVGDAAHTLHPLAGQGVNLGLLDVAQLVNELCRAKLKMRDIGAARVLARYERRRKLHNQMMIWSMELFKRGFASRNSVIQRLRNMGLHFVDQQKSLKQLFAKVAMGTL